MLLSVHTAWATKKRPYGHLRFSVQDFVEQIRVAYGQNGHEKMTIRKKRSTYGFRPKNGRIWPYGSGTFLLWMVAKSTLHRPRNPVNNYQQTMCSTIVFVFGGAGFRPSTVTSSIQQRISHLQRHPGVAVRQSYCGHMGADQYSLRPQNNNG